MRKRMDLSKIPTCELIEELSGREGVSATIAEPYEGVVIQQEGPAIVLVVID